MARFIQIALGSASELEYQVLLAKDLNYLQKPDFERLDGRVTEVKRMMSSLARRVRTES